MICESFELFERESKCYYERVRRMWIFYSFYKVFSLQIFRAIDTQSIHIHCRLSLYNSNS